MPAKHMAVASVVFALHEGKCYVLSVQRHEKKWGRKLILGGAGTIRPKETRIAALRRELMEELHLEKEDILEIKPAANVAPKTRAHRGYSAKFYLVQIPFVKLKRVVSQINRAPAHFGEVRSARINKVKTLAKKTRLMQPHYRDALPAIRKKLRRA